MRSAPFEAEFPLRSTGTAKMINTNKWDVAGKREITADPLTMSITAEGVTDVPGVIMQGDVVTPTGIQKNITYILYENAYPEADLIYYIDYGIAPRFEKLIRFNSSPAILDYSFRIELDAPHTTAFNKNHLSISTTDPPRGIGFKPFLLWDSYIPPTIKETWALEEIPVDFVELSPNTYRLTKHIPASFFTQSRTYPVYTDTTSTFYPDPDAEVTSVDGMAYQLYSAGSGVTFSTLNADAGSGFFDNRNLPGETCAYVLADNVSDKWRGIARGIDLFDTSSIPDADTISSATLSIYGEDKFDVPGWTPNINVYSSSPASNTALAAGDYDSLGSTAYSTAIAYGSFSTGAYNTFTFNGSGITNISKTGVSKFGTNNNRQQGQGCLLTIFKNRQPCVETSIASTH